MRPRIVLAISTSISLTLAAPVLAQSSGPAKASKAPTAAGQDVLSISRLRHGGSARMLESVASVSVPGSLSTARRVVRNRSGRETICFVAAEPDYKGQFTELMEAYANPIRRLCAAYAANAADREDLSQDIFFAVWRALPDFRGDASVRTWLYRIAHNVALTWRTRDRRRQSRESPLDQETAGCTQMDLRRLALKRAIAGMSPGDRTLTLLWLEGLSGAEIEEVTGVKSATVAVRLSRIRKQLQPIEVMP